MTKHGAPAADTGRGTPSRPFYLQLWFLVLAAIAVGVALGHFYQHAGVRMEPLGEAFIKAIRVLIAPIIFCTVVHGIAGMANMARVGRVALKALIYFEVVTTVALIIGLIAVNLWEPGRGMNVDLAQVDTSSVAPYIEQTQRRTAAQFLLGIIPNTFVGAFGEGNVLQVLFVSVLCGFALGGLGAAGKPLTDLIEAASRMFFAIVAIVMWAAPIGAFGATPSSRPPAARKAWSASSFRPAIRSISTAPVSISRPPRCSWRRRPTRRCRSGSSSGFWWCCSSPRKGRRALPEPPSSCWRRRLPRSAPSRSRAWR